jgi:Domain of unknown function (DUF4367)
VRSNPSVTLPGTYSKGTSKKPIANSKHQKTGVRTSTSQGRVLDGFFSKGPTPSGLKNIASKARTGVSPIINTSASVAGSAGSSIRQTAQTVHRSAQRSKTLMRTAVSKPINENPKNISLFVNKSSKASASKVNPLRAAKAKTITKNAHVRRFNPLSHTKAPATAQTPVKALQTAPVSAKATATNRPLPSMVTSASHHQIERLLDQALHRADAHKQALHGRGHNRNGFRKVLNAPRWLSFGSAFLVIALLGGFFAWQNIPQISMRVASAKSSVDASVPDYTPPGFGFSGPISYTDDAVKMSFKANSDSSRGFTLVQEASPETSPSLAANSLNGGENVQTSQVNGTTVYIYGDNNHAMWVNKGIRYTIEDGAKLNSDQILKIADSLH